jgi:excisionase family DNA binding protein
VSNAAERIWPEVMDLMTAADYMGFHPVTLREWKRKGEGPPGRKVGGRWRFHKPALDAYLAGTKQPAWPQNLTNLDPVAKRASCGFASPRPTDRKYIEALGLQIGPSQPSGRRSSTRNTTGSQD